MLSNCTFEIVNEKYVIQKPDEDFTHKPSRITND